MYLPNPSTSSVTVKKPWSLSTLQVALILLIGGACFLVAVWFYANKLFGWGFAPQDLWSICTTREVKTTIPSTSVWAQSLSAPASQEK